VQRPALARVQRETGLVVGIEHGLHLLPAGRVARRAEAVERPRPPLPGLRLQLVKEGIHESAELLLQDTCVFKVLVLLVHLRHS